MPSAWSDDKEIVDRLCAIEDGLSEWEVEFVDSVAKWVNDQKRMLSDKQRAICERILPEKG